MNSVLLTNFEKAVVKITDHLFLLDKQSRGFEKKQDYFDKLKLDNSNWHKVKTSDRHIPDPLHAHIKSVLISEFSVNPGFFNNEKLPMFLSDKYELHEDAAVYKTPKDELKYLRAENARLHNILQGMKGLLKSYEK